MSEQAYSTKLSGVWYNELGSTMTLTADATGGLSGKYNSAVGEAEDFYILAGRFDAFPPSGGGVSVGWAVTFRNQKLNAHSTTTWSGQYFDGGDEKILTHWLLTSSTPLKSIWNSTNVGHDTFTRKKPSATTIAKVQALAVDSPQPEDILSQFFDFFHSVRPASHPFFSNTGFNSFSIIQNS
jgi:Avidin family